MKFITVSGSERMKDVDRHHSGNRVLEIDLGEINEYRETGLARQQCQRRLHDGRLDMPALQCRPSLAGRPQRDDRNILFRVETDLAQRIARNKIRAGADLAYSDPFPFQVRRSSNR